MSGESAARMQLLAIGPQDAYVWSTDGVSPWKAFFKRASRFAMQVTPRPFPNGFVCGKDNKTDIPLAGDCLGTITLEIQLPAIPGASEEDTWVPSIGHVLLRRIKLWLNETLISDQERLWYDLHDKLFGPPAHTSGMNARIGRTPLPLTRPHVLHVPLKTPWSLHNFFPTIAMPGVSMAMEIQAEHFDNCIVAAPQMPRMDAAPTPTLAATLTEPGAELFGHSIAVSQDGSLVVVGAQVGNGGAGTAFVYLKSSNGEYTLQATLVPPRPVESENSTAVAISANNAMIAIGKGKTINEGMSVQSGAVYIYAAALDGTWTLQQTITEPTPAVYNVFGACVSFSQTTSGNPTTMVITSPFAEVNSGVTSGTAYEYTLVNGTWSMTHQFVQPGVPPNDDHFGNDIAFSARGDVFCTTGLISKCVYIYAKVANQWTLLQIIGAGAGVNAGQYIVDISMSLDASTLILFLENPNSRVVYYRGTGDDLFVPEAELQTPGLTDGGAVAAYVSADGQRALVKKSSQTQEKVYVYMYERTAPGAWSNIWVFSFATHSWHDQVLALTPDGSSVFIGSPFTKEVFIYNVTIRPVALITTFQEPGAEQFGRVTTASKDGSIVVVCSNSNDSYGRTFVYTSEALNVYTLQSTIVTPSPSSNSAAVAISSDNSTLAIGKRDAGSGAVYLYTNSNGAWSLTQTLVDPSPGANENLFGMKLCFSESYPPKLLVASPNANVDDVRTGIVHEYTLLRGSWSLTHQFINPRSIVGSAFGDSIGVSGDGNTACMTDSKLRSVSVYGKLPDNQWTLRQEIAPSINAESDVFSDLSLTLDGLTFVIGSAGDAKALVYSRQTTQDSFALAAELRTPGLVGPGFGNGTAISGDGRLALIGSGFSTTTYLFSKNAVGTWTPVWQFQTASASAAGTLFLSPNGLRASVGDFLTGTVSSYDITNVARAFQSATYVNSTVVRLTVFQTPLGDRTIVLKNGENQTVYTLIASSAAAIHGVIEVTQQLARPWEVTFASCDNDMEQVRVLSTQPLQLPSSSSNREELSVNVLYEYAFLDPEERNVLLQEHTYWPFNTAIDMEAKTYKEILSTDGRVSRVTLERAKIDLSELNFPVRGLVWVVYAENYATFFNYERDALETCQLFLNNVEATGSLSASHFQMMTKLQRGLRGGKDGIHYLPFALYPGASQPSGAIAFDKTKQPYLSAALTSSYRATNPRAVVKLFAIARRLLVLHKGRAGFVTV